MQATLVPLTVIDSPDKTDCIAHHPIVRRKLHAWKLGNFERYRPRTQGVCVCEHPHVMFHEPQYASRMEPSVAWVICVRVMACVELDKDAAGFTSQILPLNQVRLYI